MNINFYVSIMHHILSYTILVNFHDDSTVPAFKFIVFMTIGSKPGQIIDNVCYMKLTCTDTNIESRL